MIAASINTAAMGYIGLAGSSAAVLAAMVLWRLPYGHRRANHLLSALMAVMALLLFQRFLSYMGIVQRHPNLQGLAGPLSFCVGPLLYFYLRLMTERGFSLDSRHRWHALPVFCSVLLALPLFFADAESKRLFVEHYLAPAVAGQSSQRWSEVAQGLAWIGQINLLQTLGAALSLGAYALLSLKRLPLHRRALAQQFSETERLTLDWLGKLAWLAVLVMLATLLSVLLAPFASSLVASQFLPLLLMVVVVFYGGYRGICQPLIYSVALAAQMPRLENESPMAAVAQQPQPGVDDSTVKKYENSGLDGDGQKLLWAELQRHMADQRPYLTGGLTIAQLAAGVGVPVAYLSQTINAEAGVSFFDYINRARINEACRLLTAAGEEKKALSTLYLEVGFNSKSSFYSQFKKYCGGATPRDYIVSNKV